MSAREVSFILVGSIVWTISWLTVPSPTTGMPAVIVTGAPGATVALLLAKVIAPPVASATSSGTFSVPASTASAIHTRP